MTPAIPSAEQAARDIEAEVADAVKSRADLMDMAYVMESEAAERYAELADQMEIHNNPEVATVFAKLAAIEGEHAKKVEDPGAGGPKRAPWEYRWIGFEAPESTPSDELHYLMTPHHALSLARLNEQRAEAFYRAVARLAGSAEVRNLAAEMADEERGHVELIDAWLAKYPPPEVGWDEDPDPPNAPD